MHCILFLCNLWRHALSIESPFDRFVNPDNSNLEYTYLIQNIYLLHFETNNIHLPSFFFFLPKR